MVSVNIDQPATIRRMSANFLVPYFSMRRLANAYGQQVSAMHLNTFAIGQEFAVWYFVQPFFSWQPRRGPTEMTYSSFPAPCLHVNVSFKSQRDAIGSDFYKNVHRGPEFLAVPQVTYRLVKETKKLWML